MINELIREYLVFNNYLEAASVFAPETGERDSRASMCHCIQVVILAGLLWT